MTRVPVPLNAAPLVLIIRARCLVICLVEFAVFDPAPPAVPPPLPPPVFPPPSPPGPPPPLLVFPFVLDLGIKYYTSLPIL